MLRTAWRAAKARVGSLLAGGRPPAPRPGLREPSSQASMAMSASTIAPDPLLSTSILEFTLGDELDRSGPPTRWPIERWAFREQNVQPERSQLDLPRDKLLRLQASDEASHRPSLAYLPYQLESDFDHGDALAVLGDPPVAQSSSKEAQMEAERWRMRDFKPESPTTQPSASLRSAVQHSSGASVAEAFGSFDFNAVTSDVRDGSAADPRWRALHAADQSDPPAAMAEALFEVVSGDELASEALRERTKRRRPDQTPPFDLAAASSDDWQLLQSAPKKRNPAPKKLAPAQEPTMTARASVDNASDVLPRLADALSPSIPPTSASQVPWDPNNDPSGDLPVHLDAPVECGPLPAKTIGDDGSPDLEPFLYDAEDLVECLPPPEDWFDFSPALLTATSSPSPSSAASSSTAPAVTTSIDPAAASPSALALAVDPPSFLDDFDVVGLLNEAHDRVDHKAVQRQLRLDHLRWKRAILEGTSETDRPLVKHIEKVKHTSFYGYRFRQADLHATYAEQYEHVLRFYSGIPRADMRSTFEDHPAFNHSQFSTARFSRAFARQVAADRGWVRPTDPRHKTSYGYRTWANQVQLTKQIMRAVEKSFRASVAQSQNSTVQHIISVPLHAFDLLVDEVRAPGASLKSLADKHGVQLEVLKPPLSALRILRVTGPYSATRSFEVAVQSLIERLKSTAIDLRIGSRWTAEQITREILEPHFRMWQRSLGTAFPMDRLHVTLNRATELLNEITFASVRQEMISFAMVAVANRLAMPRQAMPLYVVQGSEETTHSICRLEPEPDTGHYRLRAIPDRREEHEHVGGASDLRCDSRLAPLSSINVPSGDDIYQPELQDALEIGPVDRCRSSSDDPFDVQGPATRIEARFGKFTFPSDPPLGPAQVHDLAAELSSKRTFTPQTGTAVERLKRDWIAGKKQLSAETFYRVRYVSASRISTPTSSQALRFEWDSKRPGPRKRVSFGERANRGKGKVGPKGKRRTEGQPQRNHPSRKGEEIMVAFRDDLRSVNVLFPKRNFDAILSKTHSHKIDLSIVPKRLRRAFRLWPERWATRGQLTERNRAAIPCKVRRGGKVYLLDKNEEVERREYLVEDERGPNGALLSVPTGRAGRKVVVERVICHRTGVSSEFIILEADDPRKQGMHPDAYLPEDMLKDVNHMLCMEDQSW